MRNKEVTFNEDHEPIVFSKILIDLLLRQGKSFSDLLALYTFYYYTAKWQKTNQPKATTSYCAEGLTWPKKKIQKIKKELKKLGLIEDIVIKEKQLIVGHYIKINFIWTTQQAEKAIQKAILCENVVVENSEGTPSYYAENSEGTNNHRVKKDPPNASSTNKPNASSTNNNINIKEDSKESSLISLCRDKISSSKKSNKLPISERNEKFQPLAKQLAKIVEDSKNIKVTANQIKFWTNDIRLIEEKQKIPFDRIKTALDWYEENIGGSYVPVIASGSSLKEKFVKLENAIVRDKNPLPSNKPSTGYKEKNKKYRGPDIEM